MVHLYSGVADEAEVSQSRRKFAFEYRRKHKICLESKVLNG
ncbi:hypothetical protein TC41_1785 [Alicyclobacillus acidocaldarius subsp. acidocaldarius Tc-4-1]|uniref:Uncharacterized protein n=1 Tax=Alicyclobacillus acidocaldarius (strain Tc-4-1) TaxID=1048834 RepID=F8ICP1_ALIAT|nr:hypothetical protein TC41_1785 [Alicyclobacillus acidocaldarius subsp. acidocaldarius Tc-4-1]